MTEGVPVGETGGVPVLAVTQQAGEKIRAILAGQEGGVTTIRVTATAPGKYAMNLEPSGKPGVDDTVLPYEGFQILVDAQSRPLVEGASLNWLDTYGGGGFQFTPPAQPARPRRKDAPEGAEGEIWRRIEQVLEEEVNPAVASHGGYISLIDYQDGTVYVEMGGGCQGCAMSKMTLKQGVERLLMTHVPEVQEILDITDHAGGRNPYYAPTGYA